VIAQFFIAMSLISFTWLIFRQVQYLRSRDLGMQADQVVCIAVGNRLGSSLPAFRHSLEELATVRRTTSVRSVPPAHPGDTSFEPRNSHQVRNFSLNTVDGAFLATLEIPLLAGRNFNDDHPADSAALILNETAVRELGWDPEVPEAVIGQLVDFTPDSYRRDRVAGKIIGICRDFHFEQLHRPLRPLALQHGRNESWLLVKLQTAELRQSMVTIESIWKKLAPGDPFQYHFMDESFDAAFRGELMLGRFFSLLTGITTLVASLGLFGLSVYVAERKTREIGIRKTAGATNGHILFLLGTGFIRPVLIAFLLAIPVSFFLMQWWLRSFVYRTPVSASIFLFTGSGAVAIALLTVAFQSWKAARISPTDALRHE
jgi:putative ABC transport system permease protein